MQENEFIAVALLLLFGILLAAVLLILTHVLGPRVFDPAKLMPYECGPDPEGCPRHQYSVHFYLIAIFFILFDIEAVFMYPWAVVYAELVKQQVWILWDMLIFIGILAVGFIYIWKKRALEWDF
ncbi:MAG: NADH-quinone oxidoreductase subunit A [Deltaproteobacteria bacterium]|nr:NADH-quinone oxidoreductase subunit A [Deltaproteobacteria bacterium]